MFSVCSLLLRKTFRRLHNVILVALYFSAFLGYALTFRDSLALNHWQCKEARPPPPEEAKFNDVPKNNTTVLDSATKLALSYVFNDLIWFSTAMCLVKFGKCNKSCMRSVRYAVHSGTPLIIPWYAKEMQVFLFLNLSEITHNRLVYFSSLLFSYAFVFITYGMDFFHTMKWAYVFNQHIPNEAKTKWYKLKRIGWICGAIFYLLMIIFYIYNVPGHVHIDCSSIFAGTFEFPYIYLPGFFFCLNYLLNAPHNRYRRVFRCDLSDLYVDVVDCECLDGKPCKRGRKIIATGQWPPSPLPNNWETIYDWTQLPLWVRKKLKRVHFSSFNCVPA